MEVGSQSPKGSLRLALLACGVLGLVAMPLTWWAIQPFQVNIIHYELQQPETGTAASVAVFSICVFLIPIILAAIAAVQSGQIVVVFFELCSPLVLAWPLGASIFTDRVPSFHFVLLAIVGAGAAAFRSGSRMRWATGKLHAGFALASVWIFIALLTLVHFRIQLNFYNHFMLGHADIGHFTEELKNALAGRGLRSDSFDNTRLGWHFVPLMFVLVPGYALWPSIHYLMVMGPLVLHLAALPVFWFVRRRTSSVLIAWISAIAWLLLPSLSRLVYSNTYGFAWLYTAVPLAALLVAAALLERWRLCWFIVAVLLLSRETHTAVTLGFGLYLTLFTPRRRAGLIIIGVSVAYALLCAEVIIPHFAKAARYERLDMFGELGGSVGALAVSAFTRPGVFFGRLIRPQSLNFVLLLLAAMCFLPLRGWRVAVVAVPSLMVHLLLAGTDWISIKFWHHAMVLPALFVAALSTMRAQSLTSAENPNTLHYDARQSRNMGIALALVSCAAWGHYFFGFSPLSKSYEVYSNDPFLQNPDPRLAFIDRLRGEISRDHTILATERVAAHFTDYKRIYTGRRVRLADFVILDRLDALGKSPFGWDSSGLAERETEFAQNSDYERYAESGSIIVFKRKIQGIEVDDESSR